MSNNLLESYLRRALNKLDEAKYHLDKNNYPESISASQEVIELSVKAIFLLHGEEYSRKHKFKEEEFSKLLKIAPKDVTRVFLLSEFWSKFYTIAKYGYETLGIDQSIYSKMKRLSLP
jgi:HEPN domain-containing protein